MPTTPTPVALPQLHWTEAGQACSALWRSERGATPPKRVVLVDDTLNADVAYRLACEGTGLLWRGDYHQARQMLQALGRRLDRSAQTTLASQARKRAEKDSKKPELPVQQHQALEANSAENSSPLATADQAQAFHRHRQAQGHRARVLGMLLLQFGPDHGMDLRRAPDARQACAEGWGPVTADTPGSVASLRELLALVSAHEWQKAGVEIPALGLPPHNRIHPRYGVFSPVRGEYVDLVAAAPLPAPPEQVLAFDIGTGTGVLSAVLARRGVARVVATDMDGRALACARANLQRLGALAPPDGPAAQGQSVELLLANLFPPGRAQLVVCNPPWLPARASSPIEHAVYDEGSRMLRGFLNGLAAHLAPGGEGWLIMSDLAEHLGLRTPTELTDWVNAAGLRVVGKLDARPQHPKARDASDPLHAARAAEVTSLWRLAALAG
ncbi:MAG: methyltransferase [Polaromonas sp.]|nr:methyltransferase [Polaromonas sp.]